MIAKVWEPIKKLTLVKADWTCNRMYQDLYDRAKETIKKDAFMKFYDTSRPLYLETNASGSGLGLLQVIDGMNCGHNKIPDNATMCPMAFTSRSLLSAEWCYNNIE